VLMIGVTVFMSYCFVGFMIIPLYLTPYDNFDINLFILYAKFILFGNYYIILFVLFYTLGKNIYTLLVVVCGYFISNVSTEYFMIKDDINLFAKVTNSVFVDIGFYLNIGFDFYYGSVYSLILLIGFFQLIIFLSNKYDILN
ncbi:MAG: hypothetical protein KJ847_04290, partial [Firmicutes bacterium]|nr:hypothetical protein [Bacillota bacterium]